MTENTFNFDLQRFNDEEGQLTEPVAEPQDPNAPEAAGQPEEVDFDFAIDADGNVVFRDDEPEEPEGQPKAEPTPQAYKVKVDGQEVEVPLEELLSGYQRQAD